MAAIRPWCVMLAVAVLLTVPAVPAAAQQERILSFDSRIAVRSDGRLNVVETIEVEATGQEIRRGIFRDLPTRSVTGFGFNRIVGIEILGISRDGAPEPYFTEELNAGVRIYIGSRNVMLRHGRHRYTIEYETSRQLFQRPGEDELYWNVTGDAWAFRIDRASATVLLPAGAAVRQAAAYTGPTGAQGTDYEMLSQTAGRLSLRTTRALAPGEGLTLAVSWPAGSVARPGGWQQLRHWGTDNAGVAIGGVLLLVLLGYFGAAWLRVGRDPDKGTIVPLFEPPDGLSPVAVGYIWNNGFTGGFGEGRALSVALTSLATKRLITLGDEGGGQFSAWKRRPRRETLPPGERAVYGALFGAGDDGITFGAERSKRMQNARDGLMQAFGVEYGRAYFLGNRGLWSVGALLALGIVLVALTADVMGEEARVEAAVLSVFGIAFTVPALAMLGNLASRWLGASGYVPFGTGLSLVIAGACSLPAAGVGLVLAQMAPPAALAVAGAALVATMLFWYLLSAPTLLGRQVLDGIEGYRLYLSVAKADRLNVAGRVPEITEALYETHLPYAMALGVEQAWTDKLTASMAASAGDPATRRAYEPDWLVTGDGRPARAGTLATTLSRNLGGAAAFASTRPSSSSSSGGFSSGGGSSGGGGGGGGGGGW